MIREGRPIDRDGTSQGEERGGWQQWLMGGENGRWGRRDNGEREGRREESGEQRVQNPLRSA